MEWTAVRGTVHGGCTEWFPDGRVKSLANYCSGIELKFQEWNGAGELVIARELPGGSPLRALVERLERSHSA